MRGWVARRGQRSGGGDHCTSRKEGGGERVFLSPHSPPFRGGGALVRLRIQSDG